MGKRILICDQCGSDEVNQEIKWDPNLRLIISVDEEWCRVCEDRTRLVPRAKQIRLVKNEAEE